MLIESIKKVVTEEKSYKEITLPYYVKEIKGNYSGRMYAIISEKEYMEVDRFGILVWESEHKVKEIAGLEPATEAEFIAAYTTARDRTKFELPQIA